MSTKHLTRLRNSIMPTKSIYSQECYRVGTSSASLVGLSNFQLSYREIHTKEVFGLHVSYASLFDENPRNQEVSHDRPLI